MKRCAKCDLSFPDSSAFCKKCGGPLIDNEVTVQAPAKGSGSLELICPNCGKPYRPGAAFCKGCGKPLVDYIVSRADRSSQISDRPAVPPTVAAIPTTSADEGVKCGRCGTLNQSGMKFCKSCRAPIGAHAKKVRTKRVLAVVLASASVFAVLVGLLGWYLWGVKATIMTEPAEAKIAIDGNEVGVSNSFGLLGVSHIRAGKHNLIVKRDGYDDLEQSFDVSILDFSKRLHAKLNLTKFKLTVIASPTDSAVMVDSGVTIAGRDANGNPVIESLTPGDHLVVVSHEGYRDWKQNVTVKGDTKIQVTLTSAPVMDENADTADYEIRNALEGWAQSTRNRDVDSHLRYYSDTLDYYYNRTLVPSSKVREDRMRAFAKFNYLSVQLSNMNIQLDSTGQRATVVFDKTFDFRGDNNAFYNGSVQDQLTLTKLGGAWLITGEKELKIYYVNK